MVRRLVVPPQKSRDGKAGVREMVARGVGWQVRQEWASVGEVGDGCRKYTEVRGKEEGSGSSTMKGEKRVGDMMMGV